VSEIVQRAEALALMPIQRWPTQRSRAWVSGFLESALLDDNIVVIIAVGSAVRRNVTSADLDLVLLVKDISALKAKPPIEVDLRAYPLDQVDTLIAGGTDLLGWSVNYGKVLVQKQHAWDQILTRWQGRVPLPFANIATQRAAEALRRFTNMMEIGDYDAAHEQALSYLTHLARAELIKRKVYPASRPELPDQLRAVHSQSLAESLDKLIQRTVENQDELAALVKSTQSH
jgi:hypothetical protein